MGTTLGTVVQNPPPVRKTERVLNIRPLEISLEAAAAVIALLHEVAAERVLFEASERLRLIYRNNPQQARQIDAAATNEDDFVTRHVNNPNYRVTAHIPPYEKYTFLSPTSHVQFESSDFTTQDLPKDVNLILAHVDGINGRFVDVKVRSMFKDFNEVRDPLLNQFVVHGENRDWVNATFERIRSVVEAQQFKTRSFIYGHCLSLFWVSVMLLLFAEYRVVKLGYPTFSLATPLSGTGALVMFGILMVSILVFANTIIRAFGYVFPYFEIDGNLSRSRTGARKLIAGVVSGLYVAAMLNVISLVFSPVLQRISGH